MLYIFSSCREFLRTLPTLQYSRTHPEDVDSELEDHIADETRYLCMRHPIRAVPQKRYTPSLCLDPLDRPVPQYVMRTEQRENKN